MTARAERREGPFSKLAGLAAAIALCLFAAAAASAVSAQQAWADGYLQFSKAASTLSQTKVGDMFLFEPATLKNIKSSNSDVVSAFRDGGAGSNFLVVSCNKAGRATISFTADGKSYVIPMTVAGKSSSPKAKKAKYVNPVKKLKVGSANYAKKFKKSKKSTVNALLKGKVKITAKKGWKLAKITVKYKGKKAKKIKNGKKVVPEHLQYLSVKMKKKGSGKTVTLKLTQGKESIGVASADAIADQDFANGTALTPAPVLKDGSRTLVNGTDYTLSYANNVHVGLASVKVTGKGAYAGTRTLSFRIRGSLNKYGQLMPVPDQVYTGARPEPELTIVCDGKVLKRGVDYEAFYFLPTPPSASRAGVGTVTVHGIGYYKDYINYRFNVVNATSASSAKALRAA